jgi:hypothetical protein
VRSTRGSGRSAKCSSKSVMRPERRARSARGKTEHLSRAFNRTPVQPLDALALARPSRSKEEKEAFAAFLPPDLCHQACAKPFRC